MPSTIIPLKPAEAAAAPEPQAEPAAAVLHASEPQEAIAEVAKKGFDLLWIGTEPGVDASGVIDVHVADLVSAFDGHFVLVVARGARATEAVRSRPRVLVPVTGTAHSRRATELALALAQACRGSVTALHVSAVEPKKLWRPTRHVAPALRREEEALLREMTDLAQQYGTQVTPLARTGRDAAEVILEELDRGIYGFVVLGVTPRPGETLSLGSTARVVLARSPQSVLLHAS